ncbi:MAG: S9 family peptidase [Fimbriimonadales bacterium]|nr:S9 family peptidase [Fimbriimonadales bacterium]
MVCASIAAAVMAPNRLNHAEEPVAPKRVHVRELHGERFEDPYFWMRERENPDVRRYLEACNAHAERTMEPTKTLQERLYREMLGRIQEDDTSVPVLDRGYYYYRRTEKGKPFPIYCRKRGSLSAREELLLDLNQLAKGKRYVDVDFAVSPDGTLLAYALDDTGSRDYILRVKDLRTGRLLRDAFGPVTSFVWAQDSRTLFFTTEDDAKRSFRVFRRRLGSPKAKLLYEERDPLYNVFLAADRDRRFAYAVSASQDTTECRLVDLRRPTAPLRLIQRRLPGIEYYPSRFGDRFLIRTNDGAREFRLAVAPAGNPGKAQWRTVLKPRDGETIEAVDVFRRYWVVRVREDAVASLRVVDLRDWSVRRVAFPEPYYTASVDANPELDARRIRISYESAITPRTVYDYDPRTGGLQVLKRQPVPGYEPSSYEVRMEWATARDGERVPIALAYRKGTRLPAPMLLDAYGAYGISNEAAFRSSLVSLLDRGWIVGTALVRGGGEMGERWHDAGKMARKINTFRDLIDCVRHLQRKGYTTPRLLAVTGGSAGGLTVGAVLNEAPELFRAALVLVPFVDVINTMLDESLPLTTGEFIEWGNPKIREQYRWIRAYSPYDNVKAQAYPAMLVRTSWNDTNVPYWEAAKWVARLRELRTDRSTPLLLKVDFSTGHGGASGRYDALRDAAFDQAFLLTVVGEP